MNEQTVYHYSTEGGLKEYANVSAAKDIVLAELEDLDPDYAAEADHIDMADQIVEALIKVGVTIPENLVSPFRAGAK